MESAKPTSHKSQVSSLPRNCSAFCQQPGLHSSAHQSELCFAPPRLYPTAELQLHSTPRQRCTHLYIRVRSQPKAAKWGLVWYTPAWRASYHWLVLIERTWKCRGGSAATVISWQAASKGSDSCGDVLGSTHPARSNIPVGLFIIPDSRVSK